MQSQLIASTIAFICAWSQPNCDVVKQVPIVQTDPFCGKKPPANSVADSVSGSGCLKGNRAVQIYVNPRLTDIPYIGVVLAHETTEILRGTPPTGKDCGVYEGFDGQTSFALWFIATYGPPSPEIGTLNNFVWQQSIGDHYTPVC